MTVFKLPFMPKTHIEREAAGLLASYFEARDRKPEPGVPVEDIAEMHLELDLAPGKMEALLGVKGVLGATWIDEAKVRIDQELYDRNDGRYAFTVAHEIGHWVMHRPLLLAAQSLPTLLGLLEESVFEDGLPPNIVCRSGDGDSLEWQADQFAACLLMPADLMRATFARLFPGGQEIPVSHIGDRDKVKGWINYHVSPTMLREGGFSNCSRVAMTNRVEALNLVNTSGTRRLL